MFEEVENQIARIPETDVLGQCSRCEKDMRKDDTMYQLDIYEPYICEECFMDAIQSMSASDIADRMGIETRSAQEEF